MTLTEDTDITEYRATMKTGSINQGGYVYIYLSIENTYNLEVYLDNPNMTPTKGGILQKDHYYPFGLNISALSSTAPLSKPNNFKYNGFEEQTDFDLGWYDFGARNFDPQLGRWHSIDPMADKYTSLTPYDYVTGNPMNLTDPNGMDWYKNDATGSVLWRDSSDDEYTNDDGDVYANIGQYFATTLGGLHYFFDQQNFTVFDGNEIATFVGFDDDRYQQWDSYILGFAAMNSADPNFVKSIMIQEAGCAGCGTSWRNDPMTMFNPGDYDANKGIGTLEEATTMFSEADRGRQYANGILSIKSGIQWLYGPKRTQANSRGLFPGVSESVPEDPWQKSEQWRMAWRYNGSNAVLGDSGIQRRFAYGQRVVDRVSASLLLSVPTGTAGFRVGETAARMFATFGTPRAN